MTAWTTGGGVDRFFEIINTYAPPPPPRAGVPFEWGEPDHSEELLGDAFELKITRHDTPWKAETPDEIWELLSKSFGPIKTLLGLLPPERAGAFRVEMMNHLEEELTKDGIALERLYILVVGTRKADSPEDH